MKKERDLAYWIEAYGNLCVECDRQKNSENIHTLLSRKKRTRDMVIHKAKDVPTFMFGDVYVSEKHGNCIVYGTKIHHRQFIVVVKNMSGAYIHFSIKEFRSEFRKVQ